MAETDGDMLRYNTFCLLQREFTISYVMVTITAAKNYAFSWCIVGSLGTNFDKVWTTIQQLFYIIRNLKILFAKWRPFYSHLNVLTANQIFVINSVIDDA